jgi:hypothetical protein
MSWGPMEKLEFVLIVSLVVFLCAVAVILATLLYFERRKRIRFRNNSSPSMMREFGGEMFSPQSSGRSSQVPLTSRAEAVRFESPTGRSAFEVTIPSKKYMEAQAWQKLELSNQSRQWLSPFLDGASEALKLPLLAHLATTQTFRIIFDGAGELMRSKSGGGLSIDPDRQEFTPGRFAWIATTGRPGSSDWSPPLGVCCSHRGS